MLKILANAKLIVKIETTDRQIIEFRQFINQNKRALVQDFESLFVKCNQVIIDIEKLLILESPRVLSGEQDAMRLLKERVISVVVELDIAASKIIKDISDSGLVRFAQFKTLLEDRKNSIVGSKRISKSSKKSS